MKFGEEQEATSSAARHPHAPQHWFLPNACYFVTAGTYRKQHYFSDAAALNLLLATLFSEMERYDWELQAWAVMSNHYHFIATAPENAKTLTQALRALHSKSARWINRWINKRDGTAGRKVWYQYHDTCLTYQKSYLARLNYVQHNPEKHGITHDAAQYRWCSKAWFLQHAEPSFAKTVLSFKHDAVRVSDDF